METGTRRLMVDSTSRIISILSLAVAIGSIAYVYYQNRIATPNTELVGLFDKELAKHSDRYTTARQEMSQQFESALNKQDERMESWNSQLTGAINTFRQDGEALLTRVETDAKIARQELEKAVQDKLDQIALQSSPRNGTTADNLNPPGNRSLGGDSETPTPATSTPDVDAQAESATPVNVARLKVVTVALRPADQDTSLIVIQNEGTEEASIERIAFRPESDFEVTGTATSPSNVPGSSMTTIVFEPSDNTSKRAGYHGIYDRQLEKPIRVPAGESLTLRVIIRNAQYDRYGFLGRLVLDYNGSERLSVDAARVTFRASDT